MTNQDNSKLTLREKLLTIRASLNNDKKLKIDRKISKSLLNVLSQNENPLAFYLPIKGEFNPVPVITEWISKKDDRKACIPVILKKNKPMVFLEWKLDTKLEKGIFNIPIPPINSKRIKPKIVIIPCVGFDSKNYRLGYGGGYYDRTLCKLDKDVKKIGISYYECKVEDIKPNKYDIPMDMIICS
ncbi:MAG: 5-formyltetrahydrofolate cyclo-ligase [Betaproteobacteria bacterium TMED156]|nr:MAG: 5-formyltetrahydrofolate cyclo-ligase [Betaproteobacteria bacterium TMED156]|tara:strand:+ start:17 stop:571 length:555 start_codon:yes stop_codon:yes gene_type:complete